MLALVELCFASTWSNKIIEICHWFKNHDDILYEEIEGQVILISDT